MIAYFQMSKQPVPKLVLVKEVPFKVGEECDYWLKLGEYQQERAIADKLIVDGKLTTAGLQAIDFDKEVAKKRVDLPMTLKPRTQELRLKTKFSAQKQKAKSGFEAEVKALLSKTEIGFINIEGTGGNKRLRVKVPTEKGGTTSRSFTGSESDIRRDLDEFLDAIEENINRKPHK